MRKMFLLLLAFLLSGRAISQSNGWFVPGETPTTSTLNDICTLTADTAIAVGDNGVILKTTDGGISWIVLSGGTSVHLQSVYFVNSKIGWAVGRDRTILKTLDGGETWAQQFSTMANRHGYDVFFINATTGWNVCRDDWPGYVAIVYRTSNGGNSWNSTLTGVGDNLNSLHFANTLLDGLSETAVLSSKLLMAALIGHRN